MCRINRNEDVKDLVPKAQIEIEQEALNEEWGNGWVDNQWDNQWDNDWDDNWGDLDTQLAPLSPLPEYWELVDHFLKEEEKEEDWDSQCIEEWTWELYRG